MSKVFDISELELVEMTGIWAMQEKSTGYIVEKGDKEYLEEKYYPKTNETKTEQN